jgi:glutaredoxin
MKPTVTLYTRPGCHLCDEARATLERLRRETDFAIEEVDITTDDDLHRRYLERIPVIALGREELCDYHVDEARLLDRLHYLGRR